MNNDSWVTISIVIDVNTGAFDEALSVSRVQEYLAGHARNIVLEALNSKFEDASIVLLDDPKVLKIDIQMKDADEKN